MNKTIHVKLTISVGNIASGPFPVSPSTHNHQLHTHPALPRRFIKELWNCWSSATAFVFSESVIQDIHMNYCTLGLVALCWLSCVLAEVTILSKVEVIYDRTPKLHIRGSGFDADDHNIILTIGADGALPLVIDKDYLIIKDPDGGGLTLKLHVNRRWVDLASRNPPVALILKSVKFSGNDANLLREEVILAQVLSDPTVKSNEDYVLYQTASNELRVNGTGFVGAKKVDFFFDPPLIKEVAYEDISQYPLTKNKVVLRLRHNYKWRDIPGPLMVKGVDTGGGPVKVNGDDGVSVANVQADVDEHRVSVEDTAHSQRIYDDEPQICVTGSGFNEIGNLLRWRNGLADNNVTYTTMSRTTTKLTLQLKPGSHWRKDVENLPGTLTLIAVNAGGGFVAVGPINSGKGRNVARVFERPTVYSSTKKLFRTRSHEVHVIGKGFPDLYSGFKPKLRFDPPLVEGTDYTMTVISRTELELTLVDGHAWRPTPGPLLVTQVNTRGDEAGWVKLPGNGVNIAEVKEDIASVETGGVEIFAMGVRVYQSALQQDIKLTGTGFKEGISFVLDPPLKAGIDYTLAIDNEYQARLQLKSGRKWSTHKGFIIAKSVRVDGRKYRLDGDDGICVAEVLLDPVVTASTKTYHESQSKLIAIEGTGFTTVVDTKITLRPVPSASFQVLNVMDDQIRLQLQPNKAWLSFSLKEGSADAKIALLLRTIDTGAGAINLDPPVVVGYIVKDMANVVCDDTCEFAFDGVCDDGSEPKDQYYYQNYLGGFNDDQPIPDRGRRLLRGSGPAARALQGNPAKEDDLSYVANNYNDDYYMESEEYQVSACVKGTDCTDCGGVEPLDPKSGSNLCLNTCMYPRDEVCDDPRGSNYCQLGTDCQDCGPVGHANFTTYDDGWWDDDDSGLANNRSTIDQKSDLDETPTVPQPESPAQQQHTSRSQMTGVVLESLGYALSAIVTAVLLYLLHRWYKSQFKSQSAPSKQVMLQMTMVDPSYIVYSEVNSEEMAD